MCLLKSVQITHCLWTSISILYKDSKCIDVLYLPPMLLQKNTEIMYLLCLSCILLYSFGCQIFSVFVIVPSQLSPSIHSLLSVILKLVPIATLTSKLDLLSEKSLQLVNTPLNPCERQREYLQKEYMSIDRPSWPCLVSTIARYWCAGIAFEGRQIDIMVWCGSSRAGLPVLKSDSLTLGQSIHLHWPSLVFVLRPLSQQTCRVLWEGLESFSEPGPNRIWILITLTVDFHCKQVNAIDFASAVSCIWCDRVFQHWLSCCVYSGE